MTNKIIAVVGQPGSGKSTLFNVLSDLKVSQYGSTVDLKATEMDIKGETFRLVDLPGIYSLNPNDPAEKLTTNFILNQDIDLIINVVDASLLTRNLKLTIELLEYGMPVVMALNMQDEAKNKGMRIDIKQLSEELGIPIVPVAALYGKGAKELVDVCFETLWTKSKPDFKIEYSKIIETGLSKICSKMEDQHLNMIQQRRFHAVKSIEAPELLPKGYTNLIKGLPEEVIEECRETHGKEAYELIAQQRHHIAMELSKKVISITDKIKRPVADKLDDYLLHPIWGYFILASFFGIYFFLIFVVGNFLAGILDGPISGLAELFEPLKNDNPFLWHTINGAYLGFAGVFGIVLPYFLPLVLLTSIFEDSGYMSRIAFLVDGFMHKLGLHGKSVVPFILGFGCSVPALYATRMIENRRDRIVTGILIPFMPCSARIAVIFALTAAFTGPLWAMFIFVYVLFIIALSGKLLSKIISKPIGLIMEIQKLKLPNPRVSIDRTWYKIKDFVKEAIIFLIGGSMILGWIEYFNVAQYINIVFAPVLDAVLGLPEQLGSTLLFGFFRKELIIVMAGQALGVSSLADLPLAKEQIIVFIIFVTLYFPCFTTFVVLWKEFSKKTVLISSLFSIAAATLSAFIFKIILNL